MQSKFRQWSVGFVVLGIFLVFFALTSRPTEAAGVTYYVSVQSGNDGNSCTSAALTDQTKQKKSINAGLSCLSPGDTLIVHGGTYTELIYAENAGNGTNWTSGAIRVSAATGETVWVRPPSDTPLGLVFDSREYHIWSGINIDCINTWATDVGCIQINGGHHVRFQNSEIKNAAWSGIVDSQTAGFGTHYELLNNVIHDGGRCANTCDGSHGIYLSAAPSAPIGLDTHILIEGNTIYGFNKKSYDSGVQVYSYITEADRLGGVIIRGNLIYNNGYGSFLSNATTVPQQVYNNIFRDNMGCGLVLYQLLKDTKIYNNTFDGNDDCAIEIGTGRLVTNAQIKNNAITNNRGRPIRIWNSDPGSFAVIQNNLIFGNGNNNTVEDMNGSSTISPSNLTVAPGYTNAANNNFTLTTNSALRDSGVTLVEVGSDITGISRPQGAAYDIGAYEFPQSIVNPSQDPIAWWKFDGNTNDSSGNNLNGTAANNPSFITGRIGSAIELNGVNQSVNVLDNNLLDLSVFSVSAWVKPAAENVSYQAILAKNYTYVLYATTENYTAASGGSCSGGNFMLTINDGLDRIVCGGSVLPVNTWTHLVGTYDGTVLKIYKNGVLTAGTAYSATLPNSSGSLQLGADQYGEYFRGSIDDVQLYNRALSGNEVQAIFNAAGTGPIIGDINLDHIVNSIDYSLMNAKWFTSDPTCDLNHDGLVNAIDFSMLNSNWLKTW